MLITGDDILIEYVDRLMNGIKSLSSEDLLQENWRVALDKFITHYVWHSQDRRADQNDKPSQANAAGAPYWFRLEGRLNEM